METPHVTLYNFTYFMCPIIELCGITKMCSSSLKRLAQIIQNHKNDVDMHQQKTGKKNPKTQTGTG